MILDELWTAERWILILHSDMVYLIILGYNVSFMTYDTAFVWFTLMKAVKQKVLPIKDQQR